MELTDATETHKVWSIMCWEIHFKEHTGQNMSLTKAGNMGNRYPQTMMQIKGAYRKLQEETRSRIGSILLQAINSFFILTANFWKMFIHQVADRWH